MRLVVSQGVEEKLKKSIEINEVKNRQVRNSLCRSQAGRRVFQAVKEREESCGVEE